MHNKFLYTHKIKGMKEESSTSNSYGQACSEALYETEVQ